MNRHIPTTAGLIIVILVILAFGSFYFFSNKQDISFSPIETNSQKCQPRAFAGEAKIKGWYVADEDLPKLPVNENKIQVIDITPDMEKKLKKSTENKPEEITITGFAVPCNDVALASISYKDGIFRPFLKK
jgi:hypothetical protein